MGSPEAQNDHTFSPAEAVKRVFDTNYFDPDPKGLRNSIAKYKGLGYDDHLIPAMLAAQGTFEQVGSLFYSGETIEPALQQLVSDEQARDLLKSAATRTTDEIEKSLEDMNPQSDQAKFRRGRIRTLRQLKMNLDAVAKPTPHEVRK